MTNRILIFGASGFFGRRLFEGFPELEVIGTGFAHSTTDLSFIDLRSTENAVSYAKSIAPDAIIYAAALSDTENCERNREVARRLNFVTPAAIAAATQCPMVYISSDYVFDGSQVWYQEESEVSPRSEYGKTKVAGEKAVLRHNNSNAVLRVSGLFDENGMSKGTFPTLESGSVDLISNPLHVGDAVSAVRTIIRNDISGILHAGGPDRMTRYDLLQLSRLRFWNAPDVRPVQDNGSNLRPSCSALMSERLRSIGWASRRPVAALLPAVMDRENLHLQGLKPKSSDLIVLDFVGAILATRNVGKDRLLDDIDQACGQVIDEDKFWNDAIERTGDPAIADRVADRYVINPGLWREIIQFRRDGFKLIAANNGAYTTYSKWCARLGVDLWFQDAINSVETGYGKTEAAFFSSMANRAKCEPSDFILYDDNIDACETARGLGARDRLTRKSQHGPLEAYINDRPALAVQSDEPEVKNPEPTQTCEPDARFFRQMRKHAAILRRPKRQEYFMLSAGTNLLPVWNAWPRLSTFELNEDFAQAWYTSQNGFPILSHVAALYENTTALQTFSPNRALVGRSAAMTIGASQALGHILEYVAETSEMASLLVVEPCYPLAYRQAARSRVRVITLAKNDGNALNRMLPSGPEVVASISVHSPSALLLSTPSNPSGETFSELEIEAIAEMCAEKGTLLIIDRVGELVEDQPITTALARSEAWRKGYLQCVVINSLSKSEALAGYRIGYVVGPSGIIDAVAARQLFDTMNPPAVPALPIFFILLLRCAFVLQNSNELTFIRRFARRMFRSTTAIASREIISTVERLIDEEFCELFQSYKHHHSCLGNIIRTNQKTFQELLHEHISGRCVRTAGLNSAVIFRDSIGRSEDDFCRELADQLAIAVVTESCFRSSQPIRPWFWTRISLAAQTDEFAAACEKLRQRFSGNIM